MLDKLKNLWQLKSQMDEIKKKLDGMVITVESPAKFFAITITGSQDVKEVKVTTPLAGVEQAKIEQDLKEAINKAVRDSQGMAAQMMGNITGMTPPQA